MNIIKRSGEEVNFNRTNIYNAVRCANLTSNVDNRMDDDIINSIVNYVEKQCKKCNRAIHVEEIQDFIEDRIMKLGFYNIAKNYVKYRHDKEMARRSNTTDSQILSIIENVNEEVKQENSNKNPTIASVQRDYMAGEVSKDICKRILLPKDVVQAHDLGLIHFHDMDYFAQHIYNCCLVNLEDMLQNGTVISNVLIEKPHSFSTACNIAMQIVA
jgi:ribonucleoside-triphosphate reductase